MNTNLADQNTKLILGTANLGMRYGINNENSPSEIESIEIIRKAIDCGVLGIDTAKAYGSAETIIGKASPPDGHINVTTKLLLGADSNFDSIKAQIEDSLVKTKQKKLYGLLIHNPEAVQRNDIRGIIDAIYETELVAKVGVSCYEIKDVLAAKETCEEFKLFQVPENILDQRLIDSSEMTVLAQQGNEFHVRSIFLQGLLLINPKAERLPLDFDGSALINLHNYATQHNVSVIDMCMSYARSIPWSAGNVVAVASTKQLAEILNYRETKIEPKILQTLPESIIDPRYWR